MKSITTKLPSSQKGAFYVTIIMLAMVGAVITCALKIIPAYTDNSVVKNAMSSVAARSDYGSMSIGDIRKDMLRNLQLNGVDGFDSEQIKLTREGGAEYIDINYESRIHMASNIYTVVVFNNRFSK